MFEFFQKPFYGNTVGSWALSILIIAVSILLSKLAYLLISKFIKKLTRRTKTNLDDIIIDKMEEPAVFAIIILGIWYGLQLLVFPDAISKLIGHAFYIVITFNAAWLLVRMIDALIEEYLVPIVIKSESDLDDQLLPILRKAITISIWVLAVIVGLNNAGYDVAALIAGLGLGGFAFALAAKDSISHVFGGFVLFADKPFTINDRIMVGEFDGFVREIGIRSTRIQTLDGRMVTLPNATIANDSIINISSEGSRKITLDLGLTYGTSPEAMEKAMSLLQDICKQHKDVDESKTVTAFTAFGDFSLTIRFIYYIKKGAGIFETMSEVNMAVLTQFNEHKLDFAFPTQSIQMVKN